MKKILLAMIALVMCASYAMAGNNMKVTEGKIKNLKIKGAEAVLCIDFSAINEAEVGVALKDLGSSFAELKENGYREFADSWNKETKGLKIVNNFPPKSETKADYTIDIKVKKFNEVKGYNPFLDLTNACDVDAEIVVKDASGTVLFAAYTKDSVRADSPLRKASLYWDSLGKLADEICDLF